MDKASVEETLISHYNQLAKAFACIEDLERRTKVLYDLQREIEDMFKKEIEEIKDWISENV